MAGKLKVQFDKHIWEGWTVEDFIQEIESCRFVNLKTREDVKRFCIDNQPYYKKYIPDVVNYFCNKYDIKE